jgi:hypothetical protein
LPPVFMLASCLAYPVTQKMEATCSSKMSIEFQWTTQRYISQDDPLHNDHCENLKSCIQLVFYLIACWVCVIWVTSRSIYRSVPIQFLWCQTMDYLRHFLLVYQYCQLRSTKSV